MKKNFLITILTLVFIAPQLINAQDIEELKSSLVEKKALLKEKESEIKSLNKELENIQTEINKGSGWMKGATALVGFDFAKSSNWAKNANPNTQSSKLNLALLGYANRITDSWFLRNKLNVNLGWSSLDPNTKVDGDEVAFDRNIDQLLLSSLYGKNLSKVFALSGLAEINTSVFKMFNPGSFDLGLGGTYTGIDNLVVIIHPLTYHATFSGLNNVSNKGTLGLKVAADYSNTFSNGVVWSSNLSLFQPYSDKKQSVTYEGETQNVGLFEYRWLNTIGFPVYKGIGLGLSFGIRSAKLESLKTQSFYTVGLTYNFSQKF